MHHVHCPRGRYSEQSMKGNGGEQQAALLICFITCLTVCSWLKDMMRPITSSIDGADSSSAEDGLSRPASLPSRQLVAGAAYLASTLSAQVHHK